MERFEHHSLPCIVCRQPLENVSHPVIIQPYDATSFVAYGHYGSTIIDMEKRTLKINVCDSCLQRAMDDGIVIDSDKPRIWLSDANIA